MEEEEGDDDTEDYWFFVNQWFARGEGDGEIVREFIPTDEKGRPLKGRLEGERLLSFVLVLFSSSFFFLGGGGEEQGGGCKECVCV